MIEENPRGLLENGYQPLDLLFGGGVLFQAVDFEEKSRGYDLEYRVVVVSSVWHIRLCGAVFFFLG